MKLWSRLGSVFKRRQLDREMEEEMRFHVECQEAANRAAGMSPEEARRSAHQTFGHTDSLQETCRDQRPFAWFDHLVRDVRFGLRMIAKSPGYTAVVVITLGFGIAVNTTVFGTLSSFFLDPLPLPEADRLVVIAQRHPMVNMPVGVSYQDYKDYRERLKTVSGLSAFLLVPVHVGAEGKTAVRTWAQFVSPNSFSGLHVPIHLGRGLLPSDGESRGTAAIAVLSHSFWTNHLGADPDIVGKALQLNGTPYVVVGVTAPSFHGFSWAMDFGLFAPSGLAAGLPGVSEDVLENRYSTNWRTLARMNPGVSFKEARAEIELVAAQLAKDFPDEHKDIKVLVWPEQRTRPDQAVAEVLPAISILFIGMVSLVLLIACANAANLMVARSLARRKELIMRSALGATRGRLMGQLLAESVLLSILAGFVGWAFARFAWAGLSNFTPNTDMPVHATTAVTWQTHVFTVLIAVAAGLITGIVPALKASRINLAAGLNEAGGTRSSGEKHWMRSFLVFTQITASCVVLVVSAVFLRSLSAMQHLDLGFRTEGVLLTSFDLEMQGYSNDRQKTFRDTLLERVRALPGVNGASLMQQIPMDTNMSIGDVYPENSSSHLKEGKIDVSTNRVDPSYFTTMGVTLLKGRLFNDADTKGSTGVAIINTAMAERCWPGEDPIGKRFRRWYDGPWAEVVGVTPTGKYNMLSEPPRPFAYFPIEQTDANPLTLAVLSNQNTELISRAIRDVVQSLDSDLPVYNVRSLSEHIRQSVFGFMPLRMGAAAAGAQGAIALLLSILGLYAVVAYNVTQRTKEIGVRVALGATRGEVLRLVIRDGARLTALGVVVGLGIALLVTFALSHVLYGARTFDPVVLSSVVAILAATTGLACYLPARHATRIDPVVALRHE